MKQKNDIFKYGNPRTRRAEQSPHDDNPRTRRAEQSPHDDNPRTRRAEQSSHDGKIAVSGARAHNLKNISLDLPRNKLIVITGLSGSGKSSLAFDTLYAEGQRRYVESLSAYARQFLGVMDKPDVDNIDGLSPAISIEQKSVTSNPRSTVGTITEIYDYTRLLFARVGKPHCPNCGKPVIKQTATQITDQILKIRNDGNPRTRRAEQSPHDGKQIAILAPIARDKKGEHKNIFENISKAGYLRARVDGVVMELEEVF